METAISAITLAELSAGPQFVDPEDRTEFSRRIEILQRAETQYDPLPFDASAARVYGRLCAAVLQAGRRPRRRTADLMIAATAVSEGLPLFTTNPSDFSGLEEELTVVAVSRP